MNSVSFIHRTNGLPPRPVLGTFYWIDSINSEGPQIWFAYGTSPDKMVCLNEKFNGSSFEERISEIETRLNGINERLDDIDLSPYITNDVLGERLESLKNELLERINEISGSDFGDFITRDEVEEMLRDWSPDVDLGDSDWDRINEKITEKVNEKTLDLTWTEI